MSLKEKIEADLKESLKGGNADRTGVLRLVMAQIKNKEIEKKGSGGNGELSDTEAEETLRREVKKRRESIELYNKGNRPELAEREQAEIKIIQEYLPPELPLEAVEKVIEAVIAGGASDFNSVIRETMRELKGKADGKLIAEIIRKKLT